MLTQDELQKAHTPATMDVGGKQQPASPYNCKGTVWVLMGMSGEQETGGRDNFISGRERKLESRAAAGAAEGIGSLV